MVEDTAIDELLTRIEKGEIALPDIQREFVWKDTQVRDFVQSLYRKYPGGLILLWKTPYGEEIPTVAIDEINTVDRKYEYLVIDGQQRLTSLLLVKTVRFRKVRKLFR